MRMKSYSASSAHRQFYQEFINLVRKYGDKLEKDEILALVSNIVGKLVALQDQRKLTSEQAMEIVAQNIELGNQEAIKELMEQTGERA